jgi:hypothetical protein
VSPCYGAKPSGRTLPGMETAYLVVLVAAFVAIAAVALYLLSKLFTGQR